MADVTSLDCALSKPQLLRVIQRQHTKLLGMHQIAKSLSADNLEFAQEAFEVFADDLDNLAAWCHLATEGDQAWFDEEFGSRRKLG